MFACCDCCVLSGRGLCDELITRPEESYRLWCVVVCDLETSRLKRPWPALGLSAKKKICNSVFQINGDPRWWCDKQTPPDLMQQLLSGKCGVYIWSTTYVYSNIFNWNPNSTTMERDQPRDDSPAACVIAPSILPPPFSHCALIPARKICCALKKLFQLLYLFIISVILKLLTLGIVCRPRSWTYEDRTIITVSLNTPFALKTLKTSHKTFQYTKMIWANLACVTPVYVSRPSYQSHESFWPFATIRTSQLLDLVPSVKNKHNRDSSEDCLITHSVSSYYQQVTKHHIIAVVSLY
jgi:hypothetical protein